MRGKLKSIRVRNFKAVADSGRLKLEQLNVFIGNNGSGKSSILEALQTLQRVVTVGLDAAMQAFKGMEHVKHKAYPAKSSRRSNSPQSVLFHSMQLLLWGEIARGAAARGAMTKFSSDTTLNALGDYDRYFIETDTVSTSLTADAAADDAEPPRRKTDAKQLRQELGSFLTRWQFLSIDPSRMGEPAPTRRTSGAFLLDPSGANLADYLWHLVADHGELGTAAWNGIVEALQFVLPYSAAAGTRMTTEVERRSFLFFVERFGRDANRQFEVPVWMFSTGTMRVLALLAVLRHPDPPPLICIEEMENGLDPRTLQLIVNEIRALTDTGRSQVIVTTHSPYLLDLLPLSSVIMTQRTNQGVAFTRPTNSKDVQAWATDFAPGQLYLMGRLDAKEKS